MNIPMVNLRPLLAETETAWRAHLARLFERAHFILGEQVEAFERELAAALGAKFAVGVGNGTDAIELAIRAAGLGESGASIAVPALTSPFTAQAVLAAGCKPLFVDVDPEHLLLDPSGIPSPARAVLPVHLYGQPCDLSAFPRRLPIIQDACQAIGAAPFTKASPYVALSLYPTKNLPCLGDGGAVLTDSPRVAAEVKLLRDGGRNGGQIAKVRALNSRLDEIQACYLRAFLPRLADWNADRVRLAGIYDEGLATCSGVTPIARRPGSVCHLYVVRARRRDKLRAHLAARGIATGVHYPKPLHLHPAFRQFVPKRAAFPVADKACREIVSLPLWPGLGVAAVDEIAAAIREFYRR